MQAGTAPQLLAGLGFTDTEALTYCELLRSPGSTGYRVAKAINKSQANVYAALSGLSDKGAVLVENDSVRKYSAVPAEALLSRLHEEIEGRFRAVETALAKITGSGTEDVVYHLRNSAQVYYMARRMCSKATDSIAFEMFHRPFKELELSLNHAVERGVGVAGVTFHEADRIEGATCVLAVKADRTALWPGDQLTLVTDAREALVAIFDRQAGEVMHAVCTASAYLACLLHAAVVDATILNGHAPQLLRRSFNKLFFGRIPGGFLKLIAEEKSLAEAAAAKSA
ncbi:MAG: HTH-type transcriptional regulator, sugar sensing transcriptional regulator [Sphingomonadales bacterium]|jgi:sugar-specific transcriptional regulator TrmB|nr:HTH-type transcriptional regulator, sugar sensing transcriptional regulator [Sphingomonadales bacterium]